MNTMKKLLTLKFLIFSLVLTTSSAFAQGQVGDTTFDTDDNVGLQAINIPFFPQLSLEDTAAFSILSWLSFVGGIFSIGILIFWVFTIVKAGARALRAQDNEEELQQAFNETKATFVGASIALLFPVLLSIIGAIIGIGGVWNWPQAFRTCNNPNYGFYYQAFANGDEGTC